MRNQGSARIMSNWTKHTEVRMVGVNRLQISSDVDGVIFVGLQKARRLSGLLGDDVRFSKNVCWPVIPVSN